MKTLSEMWATNKGATIGAVLITAVQVLAELSSYAFIIWLVISWANVVWFNANWGLNFFNLFFFK